MRIKFCRTLFMEIVTLETNSIQPKLRGYMRVHGEWSSSPPPWPAAPPQTPPSRWRPPETFSNETAQGADVFAQSVGKSLNQFAEQTMSQNIKIRARDPSYIRWSRRSNVTGDAQKTNATRSNSHANSSKVNNFLHASHFRNMQGLDSALALSAMHASDCTQNRTVHTYSGLSRSNRFTNASNDIPLQYQCCCTSAGKLDEAFRYQHHASTKPIRNDPINCTRIVRERCTRGTSQYGALGPEEGEFTDCRMCLRLLSNNAGLSIELLFLCARVSCQKFNDKAVFRNLLYMRKRAECVHLQSKRCAGNCATKLYP